MQQVQQHDDQQQNQQLLLTRRGALLSSWAAVIAAATAAAASSPQPAAAADNSGGPRPLTAAERGALAAALAKTAPRSKGPVLLRLAYHDAATYDAAAGDGGANASVRLELDRPENTGLKRGWGVIEQLRAALKGTPAEGLSYADLVALAGAHAVSITGGPVIDVPVGRRNAPTADPPGRMASERADAAALKANFAAKGFSVAELVALSGAHTLGGKGFGDPVTFDNAYYTALLAKPWLNTSDAMASMIGLPSDHVLPDDAECLPHIERYAKDQRAFFDDFAQSYVKLTSLGAQWG